MPHIHTEPGQHDLTVTAYIVRLDEAGEPRVLLHKHRKLGRLMPFGGHVELDETPWQAIAHEIAEESGYSLPELEVLQPKSRIRSLARVILHPCPVVVNTHDFDDTHNHTDLAFAFVATAPPHNTPADGESQTIMALSLAELDALPPDEIFLNNREIFRFILDECLAGWERVPTDTYQC